MNRFAARLTTLKHPFARFALTLLLLALPLLLLALAGLLWLWQQGLLLPWLGGATALTLLAWLLLRRLFKHQTAAPDAAMADRPPDQRWSSQSQAAWESVEALAAHYRQHPPALETGADLWEMIEAVLTAVAGHFYPREREAMLSLKVPYLLRAVELLAADLRHDLLTHIPASHLLTINDLRRTQQLAQRGQQLYDVYRVVATAVDPLSALLRETRGRVIHEALTQSHQELKAWLMELMVKKVGRYAIALYSGELPLDEEAFYRHQTSASRQDEQRRQDDRHRQSQRRLEPLRVLVIGQTGVGKTSLIEALQRALSVADAGDQIAAMPLESPSSATFSLYRVEDIGAASPLHLIDTPGYGGEGDQAIVDALSRQVDQCDLLLLVCAAHRAAREEDRRRLDSLSQRFYQRRQERPCVLVALSHIDQLRPLQSWQPPYNRERPDSPKAQQIQRAVEATAQALGLQPSAVIEVRCDRGQVYNVDPGLVTAIRRELPAIERLHHLRCLQQYQHDDNWGRLQGQLQRTGQRLVDNALDWLKQPRKPGG